MSEFNLVRQNTTVDENIETNKHYSILVSSEKKEFKVPTEILRISTMLSIMLKNDNEDEEEEGATLPLPNVDSNCTEKIIEFMKYYHENKMDDIEKPLKSSNLNEIIQPWYADFIDVEEELLFSLINAANYMDIQPLLNLGCAKVASLIKNKTPEEIREIFNVDDNNDKNENTDELDNDKNENINELDNNIENDEKS